MPELRFVVSPTRAGRRHLVTPDDVRVVLDRLPRELWSRLRTVYLNDRGFSSNALGYVTRGRRDMALCAFPERCSFGSSLEVVSAYDGRLSPQEFGAERGAQWPLTALRRFMLYNVLLHEVGHLQRVGNRFAREPKAQEFANRWRRRLWREPFAHPDPVHNPPARRQPAGDWKAQADAALDDRFPHRALQILSAQPDGDEVLFARAWTHLQARHFAAAAQEFESLLRRASWLYGPALFWLAVTKISAGLGRDALPEIRECHPRGCHRFPRRFLYCVHCLGPVELEAEEPFRLAHLTPADPDRLDGELVGTVGCSRRSCWGWQGHW